MSKKKQIKVENSPIMTNSSHYRSNLLRWYPVLIFFIGCFMYSNTLNHDYTQDDAIVIYDNMYTTAGVKGLHGLFTKDTFYGFFKEEGKAKLVSGGRYRPFTPAMFAIEYQLVGNKPWLGHFINMLLYGFLCFVVFIVLKTLLDPEGNQSKHLHIAIIASLIYAVHPLHTEVVANIKGRDEIMSMLCSMLSLLGIVRYIDSKDKRWMYLSVLVFFVGLMSKENTITFLAIIPLALYFFRGKTLISSIKSTLVLVIPTLLFLVIRASVLGFDFGGAPMELMNNPFLKIDGNKYVPFSSGEKISTILYTLGKYIQLLIWPHPLTHDYYPRHIDMKSFGDLSVIASFLLYLGLIILGWLGFKKKSIYGFGILYYLATLSIVSNIVFPIGTNMSERFMFMPSLGYALLIGYILVYFLEQRLGRNVLVGLVTLIGIMMSYKTISRNAVWVNDYTLFTTDVHVSKNSAKVLNAAGGTISNKYGLAEDSQERTQKLLEAVGYLTRATQIHPGYKNAFYILGNSYFYLKEYENAIKAYQNGLVIDPNANDIKVNLSIAFQEAGREAGENKNDLITAETYLKKSFELNPNDMRTVRLLGVLYGVKGDHKSASKHFEEVAIKSNNDANAYLEASYAFRNAGDLEKANLYLNKALSINPNIQKNNGQ